MYRGVGLGGGELWAANSPQAKLRTPTSVITFIVFHHLDPASANHSSTLWGIPASQLFGPRPPAPSHNPPRPDEGSRRHQAICGPDSPQPGGEGPQAHL